VKKRWKILLGLTGAAFVAALVPIVYVETQCTAPLPGLNAGPAFVSRLPDQAGRRAEAQTWLTYPEWSIVYEAETYARYLEAGGRPSGFAHWRQIRSFWSSLCTVNRAAATAGGSSHYKVLLYTIGISFSAELIVKAAYENTIGRLFEWIGGADSPDDRYNAGVWRTYGAFMHEIPWYRFPFGRALANEWGTSAGGAPVRHWERRFALTLEYGIKALYAKAIGWASGATLGQDERTLRFVAHAEPAAIAAIDPRLRPVQRLPGGFVAVEAPRYAQFSDLLERMARANVQLSEIAGNDDIFVTLILPDRVRPPAGTMTLFEIPLDDRPGWRRAGVTVPVPRLVPLLRATRAAGGSTEHVYDY
jgi:hypothetical protein